MKHSIPHDLDPALAKRAAERAWESYQARYSEYNPTANWTSDKRADIGFSVKGVSLKGTLEIDPRAINLSLDVPFLFKMFQGKAVKTIEGEVQKWIAKAKAGEI